MKFGATDRVGVFIDGANLYGAAKGLGFDIDYKRLLGMLAESGRLVRAYYYTALMDDQEYSPIRPLIDWLDYNGYTIVSKPVKEFTDSQGRRKIKGDMDVELAVDMLELAPSLDQVLLFSGDGDFRRLVEAVQRRGPRVTVISTLKTQPAMIADELRRQADSFVDLLDLKGEIARDSGPSQMRRRERIGPQEVDDDYEVDDADFDDDEDFGEAQVTYGTVRRPR